MHLFFENVVSQMYAHWTGKYFKGESFNDDYELSKLQWESIGTQIEKIKKDMPVEIGRPSRDIFKYHCIMVIKLWSGETGSFYSHYHY